MLLYGLPNSFVSILLHRYVQKNNCTCVSAVQSLLYRRRSQEACRETDFQNKMQTFSGANNSWILLITYGSMELNNNAAASQKDILPDNPRFNFCKSHLLI
jgi:hypothetical protein